MSNSILCNNEGILYLRCPLDASGYLNLLKQNLKLFASHVARDYKAILPLPQVMHSDIALLFYFILKTLSAQ